MGHGVQGLGIFVGHILIFLGVAVVSLGMGKRKRLMVLGSKNLKR